MLMLFGCKSDTPVQANEDTGGVVSLQKSTHFSAQLIGDEVKCTWQHYGGAAYFMLRYQVGLSNIPIATIDVVHGQKVYNYDVDVSGYESGTYNFWLGVFNKKGVELTYTAVPIIIN